MAKRLFVLLVLGITLPCSFTSSTYAAERTLWVYEGGSFENTSGTTWIETTKDVKITFGEVTRNNDFIEMYDKNRELSVRLYDTRMYWRTPKDKQWNFLRRGRWKN